MHLGLVGFDLERQGLARHDVGLEVGAVGIALLARLAVDVADLHVLDEGAAIDWCRLRIACAVASDHVGHDGVSGNHIAIGRDVLDGDVVVANLGAVHACIERIFVGLQRRYGSVHLLRGYQFVLLPELERHVVDCVGTDVEEFHLHLAILARL